MSPHAQHIILAYASAKHAGFDGFAGALLVELRRELEGAQ